MGADGRCGCDALPGRWRKGKLQEKARPAVGTGLEGIIQLSDASLQTNGVDPAFVGDINGRKRSRILYKRRIRQVISRWPAILTLWLCTRRRMRVFVRI